jgi:hypothetical protein
MPETESDPDEFELEQENEAAAEAAAIGGPASSYPSIDEDGEADPAERPLVEAGEGESEGFELAEHDLEDHASHSDQHAARRILEDADGFDEDARATDGGEADEEITDDRE